MNGASCYVTAKLRGMKSVQWKFNHEPLSSGKAGWHCAICGAFLSYDVWHREPTDGHTYDELVKLAFDVGHRS